MFYLLSSLMVVARHPVEALAHLARRRPPWRFDLISAGIGFALGALFSLIIYLMRHRLTGLIAGLVDRVRRLQERLATGIEDRYREYVIQTAERAHLLHRYTSLSQIYIERSFTLPYIVTRTEIPEGEEDEHWHQVRLHEILHPSPVAVGLDEILKQSNRPAILGKMGSGRTTILMHLARLFAARDGWRLTIPEPQETDPPAIRAARNRERNRLPAYVDLSLLDLTLSEGKGRHALLEPVVGYLGSSVRGMIARPAASLVRRSIIDGRCLLLLDNLDLLDENERQATLDWLDRLTRTYPENIFVLCGGVDGYAALSAIGFAPLLLGNLSRPQVLRFVEQWEEIRREKDRQAWEIEAQAARQEFEAQVARARREGTPPPAEPDLPPMPEPPPSMLAMWKEGHRPEVAPLDLALVAWLWREQDTIPNARLMRYAQALFLALAHAQDHSLSTPQWSRVLAWAAWEMQLAGRHTTARSALEQEIAELLVETIVPTGEEQTDEEKKAAAGQAAHRALNALLAAGDLLTDVGRGKVAFMHPTWQSFLAAQHAARNESGDTLAAHAADPRWQETLSFYAALSDATPIARARLERDDALRSALIVAAGWLATSPESDRQLQKELLGRMAAELRSPMRPLAWRSRVAELVARIGGQGSLYLFGQILRTDDPLLRLPITWGLAHADDTRAIQGLLHLLSDPYCLVRAEALHALSARGGEQLVEWLAQGLQDEDELVRMVAAQELATVGTEGHELLRDAAQSNDMYIRRAAVYGLGATGEPWAVEIVDQMSREDGEWYVRSAAGEVMERITGATPPVAPPPPQLTTQGWLIAWATRHGLEINSEDKAWQALISALHEASWPIRLIAIETLRTHGDERAIAPLREALTDDDAAVREAAYAALCALDKRLERATEAG